MVESSKETSAVVGYHMLLMTATTHWHTEHSLCSRLCVKRFPDSVGFSLCSRHRGFTSTFREGIRGDIRKLSEQFRVTQ